VATLLLGAGLAPFASWWCLKLAGLVVVRAIAKE
jgi:hypothetical protein